jgi:flagellar protein FliO/FliZ
MNGRVRFTRGAVLALALAVMGFAADDNQMIFPAGGTHPGAAAPTTGGALNNLSLVVGLVLAAAGGWFVWRNRGRAPLGRDQRALAIEETRPLGNRQYLVVASHEGKKFLLGVCPGQISLLSELTNVSEPRSSQK